MRINGQQEVYPTIKYPSKEITTFGSLLACSSLLAAQL